MLAVARPGLVVYEAPLPHVAPRMMSSSVNTVSLQFGLAKVVEMIAYEQSVRCEEASCRDARQKVLGHQPKDGKAGVIAWCINQGWSPADDNAADALLLLRYRQMLASRPSEPKRPNIPGL
jgi:hypothetical protein